MTELLRKIPCSDRLPEKEGEYDTNFGTLFFLKPNDWSYTNNVSEYPDYWLEPIQSPTDEEIERMASDSEHNIISEYGFKRGCKAVIELLTNKK